MKPIYLLIMTVLLSFGASAECSKSIVAPIEWLMPLQCQFDARLQGAYVLYKPTATDLAVGFFPMETGQLKSTPALLRVVGFQLLEFRLAGKNVKSALIDLDNDGQQEFLFRYTGPFNAIFQAIKLKQVTDRDFQGILFEFLRQGYQAKHDELHHSLAHPLLVTTNRITAVTENRDQGKSQFYELQYNWNSERRVFLARRRTRK